MMKIIVIMSCVIIFSGCELIFIGSKQVPLKIVNLDQSTALGAVYLFKAELDSGNVPGATDIIASENGKRYLPVERYNLYWDVARMRRKIAFMPVTFTHTDTISPAQMKIKVEFDYLRTFYFTADKIHGDWFITSYKDDKGFHLLHDSFMQ